MAQTSTVDIWDPLGVCGVPNVLNEEADDLDDIDIDLMCPVCHEEFQDPRFLPCHHYYCKGCIKQLAAAAAQSTRVGAQVYVCCPECRETVQMSAESGVEELPPAFVVERMKQKVANRQQESRSRTQTESSLRTCKEHGDQMKVYCLNCDRLVCGTCCVSHHAGHSCQLEKEAIQKWNQSLANGAESLTGIRDANQQAIACVQERRREIMEKSADLIESTTKCFDEIVKMAENKKQQLLASLSESTDKKLASLDTQEIVLKENIIRADDLGSQFSEKSKLDLLPEENFLKSLHQFFLQLQEEQQKQVRLCTEPKEDANIAVKTPCLHCVSELCSKEVGVYLAPTVHGSGTAFAKVGNVATFYIHTVAGSNSPSFNVQIISFVDGSALQVNITKIEERKYLASYFPKLRGRLKLTIEVDGVKALNSPFFAYVHISPTLFEKPTAIISLASRPWGVACGPQGQLVVSEFVGNSVVVLSQQGECVLQLKHKFMYPCGVAMDDDGYIYVADKIRFISKFSQSGEFVKSNNCIKALGGISSGTPHGVEVKKDRVFVCDTFNHRIVVLNRELQLLSKFGTKGTKLGEFNKPYDIVADSKGILYVVDNNNRRIQIFSENADGSYSSLYAFGQTLPLELPNSICLDVSEKYLYLTQDNCDKILVFTTSGKVVANFGKKLSKRDGLGSGPFGIDVDKDGFLYVALYSKKLLEY